MPGLVTRRVAEDARRGGRVGHVGQMDRGRHLVPDPPDRDTGSTGEDQQTHDQRNEPGGCHHGQNSPVIRGLQASAASLRVALKSWSSPSPHPSQVIRVLSIEVPSKPLVRPLWSGEPIADEPSRRPAMTPWNAIRFHRVAIATVSAALTLIGMLATAGGAVASIRPEDRAHVGRARLVAPTVGAVVGENAVRFAFELPAGARRPVLVLSRRAFDPAGWKDLPAADRDLVMRDATAPLLTLADAGMGVEGETRLWWAIAHRDGGTGALRVSEVRNFVAQPRFSNQVTSSPYLRETRRGALAPDRLA